MPLKTGDKKFDQSATGKKELKNIEKEAEVEALVRKKAWETEQKKKENQENNAKQKEHNKAIENVEARRKAEIKAIGKKPAKKFFTFLNLVVFFKVIGTISLMFLAVALVLVLVELIGAGQSSPAYIGALFSNLFYIAFTVLVMLALHEKPFIETWILLIWKWLGLGLAMIFIGVLSLGSSVVAKGVEGDIMEGACYLLFFVGVAFASLGLFGGKAYRDKKLEEDREKMEKFDKEKEDYEGKKAKIDAQYDKEIANIKKKSPV